MHPGSAPDLGNAPDPGQIRYLETTFFFVFFVFYIFITHIRPLKGAMMSLSETREDSRAAKLICPAHALSCPNGCYPPPLFSIWFVDILLYRALMHEFFYKLIGVYCRTYSIALEYHLSDLHRKPSYRSIRIYICVLAGVVDMDQLTITGQV